MHRTRIKICGIMRPADALAAVEAGADAIGMILHENAPRRIDRDIARQVVDALPHEVEVVGVFVDADPNFIRETADELQLDQVQLHGHESPAITSHFDPTKLIKLIRDDDVEPWRNVRGLLFEPGGGRYAGGNGVEADWDALANLLARTNVPHEAIVLAGGLRAENAADVVRRFRPWTVDVSSGVEQSLGVKSPEKMRAFCAAIRTVDQTL